MVEKHEQRCEACKHFVDWHLNWKTGSDPIGCCHSKKPYLTILEQTYALFELKGCASYCPKSDDICVILCPTCKELIHIEKCSNVDNVNKKCKQERKQTLEEAIQAISCIHEDAGVSRALDILITMHEEVRK